ncbi:MAG: oxidoreductase [Rhodospirillaceae bacterium]|nr:oxidoreductase [Rhodospirillaceae bacterium]
MIDHAKPLQDRIALVTGASRGIGAATAVKLAALGAHVVLVARTQGGLEEVDDAIRKVGGTASLTPLDLTEFERIDKLGAALYERYEKLDILIGNAGLLGTLGPMGHTDPQIWDQTMAVNVTANWRLIRSMDPLLRQSDAGRAIFLTSTAGQRARAYWGIYAVSKAALEMMIKTYAQEIEKTHIRANLFNPTGTRTGMRAEAFPGEDPMTIKTPEYVADQIVELALPSFTVNGETIQATNPPGL